MSNLSVGDVFKEFNIDSSLSYHKLHPGQKPLFLNRVYSSIKTDTDKNLELLAKLPGMKLHFPVKRTKSGEYENLPTHVFLKKCSFFAVKTVITFPFVSIQMNTTNRLRTCDIPKDYTLFGKYDVKRKSAHTEIIPKSKLYFLNRKDLDVFIDLICACRELLSFGSVSIFPSFSITGTDSWIVLRNKYGLVSANFEYEELRDQFFEKYYGIENEHELVAPMVFLPHFTNIPEKNIVDVRKVERALYYNFQTKLSLIIREADQAKTENELLDKLIQIDQGVTRLNKKYASMLAHFEKENIFALIGFVSVGLTFLLPPEMQSSISAAVGGITTLSWVKSREQFKHTRKGIRTEEFFLMWRVANFEKKI